jgi:beta-lactamase superfamily II metal-dependent hydrolase
MRATTGEDHMKTFVAGTAFAIVALAASQPALAQNNPARTLDITWIDVEGGAATLLVAPSGESMLVDTGYAVGDRDAKRIYAATQKAGLRKIDHLVISHFHGDHTGGLAALAKMIPIERFYDHGGTVDAVDQGRLDEYKAIAGGKRTIVKPGDEIAMAGVKTLVVSSNKATLANAVPGGGPNPLCSDAPLMGPAAGENQRMVGLLHSYGNFKFLNLIDLDWHMEMELACPINKLGTVTLYQTSRHGSLDGAGAPGLLGAIKPQVVVVNNGPRKGLGGTDTRIQPITVAGRPSAPYEKNAYLRLAKLPGIEGIWQGHLSLLDNNPAHNTTPDMIANVEETADCQGHEITAKVAADGKVIVANGRNGFSKSYMARGN